MELELGNLGDIFGTSEFEAEEGKWFPIGKDIQVKIRRAQSKKSVKVRQALEEPHNTLVKFGGKIDEATMEDINIQHLAGGIMVDWKGVTDKDGNAVPFSKNAAMYLLSKLPDFRIAVSDYAVKIENFRSEQKKEVEGN